jgi:hypothetical protein
MAAVLGERVDDRRRWRAARDPDALLRLVVSKALGRVGGRRKLHLLAAAFAADAGADQLADLVASVLSDPLAVLDVAKRCRAAGGSPRRQAELIREGAGQPFRPWVVPAAWRTATVLGLAAAADAGHLDRLPVLADALEEVGCDDADVLRHLRRGGGHVRGCWVLDGLLGRQVRWG